MAAAVAGRVHRLLRPLAQLTRLSCAPACASPAASLSRRFSSLTLTSRSTLAGSTYVIPPAACLSYQPLPGLASLLQPPCRRLTYVSLKKGKRKTVKSVVKRFLRLHCGLWLRRKAGYKKKLWKKGAARRKRLREHVFCSRTQSKLLNKMTTSFWKRRNWYLSDPYQKYHDRTNLSL